MSSTMLPSRSKTSVLVFLVPPLLLYGVAVLFPILQSLFLSFFKWDGITDMRFVGFDNYARMFVGDDVFWTRVLQLARLPRHLPGAPARRRARGGEPAHLAPARARSS